MKRKQKDEKRKLTLLRQQTSIGVAQAYKNSKKRKSEQKDTTSPFDSPRVS